MSNQAWDIERRLREALAPVEPPADLEPRLEMTLGSLVERMGRLSDARMRQICAALEVAVGCQRD